MVLFNDVVEIFRRDCTDFGGATKAIEDFVDLPDTPSISTALVNHDPHWNAY